MVLLITTFMELLENPGLAYLNTNTASDYDHASLRLESRNNAAYGTVFR